MSLNALKEDEEGLEGKKKRNLLTKGIFSVTIQRGI